MVLRVLLLFVCLNVVSCSCDPIDNVTYVCPGIKSDQAPFIKLTFDNTRDADGDGFAICSGDCDDIHDTINPDAHEICNNIDDDCDDAIDDSLSVDCWTGPDDVVFNGSSVCRLGVSVCRAGSWDQCYNEVFPALETCDGLDNDCDGEIDEPVADFCGPLDTTGACSRGMQVCQENETLCVDAVYASAEACDAIDNDCDGEIDEELVQRCSSACGQGLEQCSTGEWVRCDARQPENEVCDGLDNDCDGETDNVSTGESCRCFWSPDPDQRDVTFCMSGAVTCGLGFSECQEDGAWGPCMPLRLEEEVCNAWDDDCDGIVDGLARLCGDELTNGIGVCTLGNQTCTEGAWDVCMGAVGPALEICDNLDNDCDGDVDEELNPYDRVDVLFLVDGSGSMCARVAALQAGTSIWALEFQNTPHRFGLAVFPGIVDPLVDLLIPFTTAASFVTALSSYACTYPGVEPAWDAAARVMDPADPLGLSWSLPDPLLGNPGAHPYVIIVTDETADQGQLTETDVASAASMCDVGSCVPGDRFETFVITHPGFFMQWDEPTFFESQRLIEIDPSNEERYTQALRSFLRNLCR